jgi:hypothetical protein
VGPKIKGLSAHFHVYSRGLKLSVEKQVILKFLCFLPHMIVRNVESPEIHTQMKKIKENTDGKYEERKSLHA